MEGSSIRAQVFGKVLIAHAVGLWAAGAEGTIESTAGFSLSGGALGLLLGGLLSVPWIAVIGVVVWFQADWLEKHPLIFAVIGPLIVTGTWALVMGKAFIDAVAISCVAASVCYLGLHLLHRLRTARRERAEENT